MKQVLYACSTNPGKLREFRLAAKQSMARDFAIEPLPQLSQIAPPVEDGSSFEENAAIKARYYSAFTSELVIAEDSGLEVATLGGDPGIFSARFAGTGASDAANNDLLLSRLQDKVDRQARFVSVIALGHAGQLTGTFRGTVEGTILEHARGRHGFGYDPLFFHAALNQSFGEAAEWDKFRVSHRGEALRQLFRYLSSCSSERSVSIDRQGKD